MLALSLDSYAIIVVPILLILVLFLLWYRSRYQKNQSRKFGVKLEHSATSKLTKKLPKNWHGQANIAIPGRGDLDYLIITPHHRYAIEIKSFKGLKVQGSSLVKLDGSRPVKDPVEQILGNARRMKASPVIWLPQARGYNFNFSGCLVVQGDESSLIEELKKLEKKLK